MPIDRTQFNLLVDDDGSNTIGSPWNKAAIASVVLDPVDAAIAGTWITVPFDVANFWPGVTAAMVSINQYAIIGQTMFWMLQIAGAPSAVPTSPYLYFKLPANKSFAGGVMGITSYLNDSAEPALSNGLIVAGNAVTLAVQKWTGVHFTGGSVFCYFTAICSIG